MDKTITTALMIIVSMVMVLMLFNIAYPAVVKSGDAITNMVRRTDDRMKSQVEVIHAVGELDSDGWWQDTNGNGDFDVLVWVKNTGAVRIAAVDQVDVFFGPEGNFARVPFQANAGGSYPYWTWQVENAAAWTPAATLKIDIHYAFPLTSGRYYIKVTLPNGVADQTFLGM